MAQLTIVTTPQNSGDGTPLSTAFNYCNSNFSELYARVQTQPPATLVGSIGDAAGMYASDSTYFYYCFADYDGSSVIWGQVTQISNIAINNISDGTSNVKIADVNGNVTTSVNGTPNVVIVSASAGQRVAGNISATGNVRGSYLLGNGSQLTGLNPLYNNSNVIVLLSDFGSNTISTTGTITAGNVTGSNFLTNNIISATGNITTSGYFLGDFIGNMVTTITNVPGPSGAVLYNDGTGNVAATVGLVFDNSNPNVLTVLGSYSATGNVLTGGLISAVGNIAGGNLSGTNITGTLVTAAQNNITSVGTLSSLSVTANVNGGNLRTSGQVSATGNIRTANYLFVGQDINASGDVTATSYTGTSISLSGNITSGNIRTGGQVSATGNVTGNYILGNGSQLSGMYNNSNVSTFLAAFGSNSISTTGNITADRFIGNVAVLVGLNGQGEHAANLGPPGWTELNSNVIVQITGNANSYAQINFQNISNGTHATTDYIATANSGDDSTYFVDMGIASNNYDPLDINNSLGNSLYPQDSYVYAMGGNSVGGTGGNLVVGSNEPGGVVRIIADGSTINNVVATFSNVGVSVSGIVSTTGNITGGNLSVSTGTITVGSIVNANANAVGNIGSSSNYFNTVFALATSAQYADLAENYTSDAEYAPGTVVIFGGEKEITVTSESADERVAGVVSTNPAYLMNSGSPGLAIALRGKVPVQVIGPVNKGDSLITSTTPGVAISVGRSREYAQAVFAKSLETDSSPDERVILAVIV
jgi:hypothetical protein